MQLKKPKRPYLLRALYDWIIDSNLTPYVLVDATSDAVAVPREYVDDGKIVLNLSPTAVHGLALGDEAVTCNGRFGGRPFDIYLPMANIRAIYAKETGEGMMFDAETFPDPQPPGPGQPGGPEADGGQRGGGHLKVVK
ncbi:MAG: ClpXP protease specificity-enhancing factor [Pseudomonadales bacterium]